MLGQRMESVGAQQEDALLLGTISGKGASQKDGVEGQRLSSNQDGPFPCTNV
jgi:hypothetical protein